MDESVKSEPIGNGKQVFVSKNHTFGTDAVLLSCFAAAKKTDRLIDLGTGCGIIPFLILRDKPLPVAVGVDIMPEAAELCRLSAEKNGFDNFTAVCSDINDLKGKTEFGFYTLVTCNPPYTAENAGLKSEGISRHTARHETSCPLRGIVAAAAKLLQTGGRLCMCLRPERTAELLLAMSENKVEPKRMRFVSKTVGSAPWLVLVEGKRCAKSGIKVEPELFVYDKNGEYSAEMLKIYGVYKNSFLEG